MLVTLFYINFIFLTNKYHRRFCFKAQHPDDYRLYYKNRPILELTLDLVKRLSEESSESLKTAKQFDFLFLFLTK